MQGNMGVSERYTVKDGCMLLFYLKKKRKKNRHASLIFSKKHSHKVKSKFSRWTNFPQHKLCLGELCPHHMGEIRPFCLPVAFRPKASLGLNSNTKNLRRNKLINGNIQ